MKMYDPHEILMMDEDIIRLEYTYRNDEWVVETYTPIGSYFPVYFSLMDRRMLDAFIDYAMALGYSTPSEIGMLKYTMERTHEPV